MTAPQLPEAHSARETAPGLVLLVDDEPLLLRSLRRLLEAAGHRTAVAGTVPEAASRLGDPDLAVVLIDIFLGTSNGLDFLERVKAERPEVEVVVMTGHASIESAVGSIRRGAFDYLAKPFDDVHRVRTTVARALERGRLVQRNRELERELCGHRIAPEIVGRSQVMRALGRTLASLRCNESHVLIQGESGTGKELVARALQAGSPRAEGPFVPIDCGALPESVIESELFGHQRGAFTGAIGSPGLFRMAHRGTLFLDEVGEIPLSAQAKLLRALQHKEVRPVGAVETVPADIRVVAATHRDLDEMVANGTFRVDLFYRLNVVRLDVPPLRSRREDIPLLAHHFLEKHRPQDSRILGFEDDALERLVQAEWPGNVRELENTVESALALARGPRLRVADLRIARPRLDAGTPEPVDLPVDLQAYERAALERALRESGGDARLAARTLGIGRSTLYRKLVRHGLGRGGARAGSIG